MRLIPLNTLEWQIRVDMETFFVHNCICKLYFLEKSLIRIHPEHVFRIEEQKRKKPKRVLHLIFRLLGPQLQQHYAKNACLLSAPKVFMHGNPHLDNYVRSFTGTGMVDFDRSRMGPYAWDFIRFFSSLALFESETIQPNHKSIYKFFRKGYLGAFNNPDIFYSIPSFMKTISPKNNHLTTQNYLLANRKWAQKLNSFPDIRLKAHKLLRLYLKSRDEVKLLKFYRIHQTARCPGSLGKDHYLFSLFPKDSEQNRDQLLIDIKKTYCEPDTALFYSPVEHHGLRMIRASNLYAPNIEQRLGYFTYKKEQYWGREVPSFSVKIRRALILSEQQELAYCVGSQLGRGHRLSLENNNPSKLLQHFQASYKTIQKMSTEMNQHVRQVQLSLV